MAQNKKTQRKFRKNNKSLRVKHKGGGAPQMDHEVLNKAVLDVESSPWYGRSVFSPVDDRGIPLVCRWKMNKEKYKECEQDKYEQYKGRKDYLEDLIAKEGKKKEGLKQFTEDQLKKIIQEKNIIERQMWERVEKGAVEVKKEGETEMEDGETSFFTEKQYADAAAARNALRKKRVEKQRITAEERATKAKENKAKKPDEQEFMTPTEVDKAVRYDQYNPFNLIKTVTPTKSPNENTSLQGTRRVQNTKLNEGFRVINNSISKYVNVIKKRIQSLNKDIERLKKKEDLLSLEQNQLDKDHEEDKIKALERIDRTVYTDIKRANGTVFTADAQKAEAKAVWETRTGSKPWVNVKQRKKLKETLVEALQPFTKFEPTSRDTIIAVGKGRQLKYQILSMNFSNTELWAKYFSAGQETNEHYIHYEVEWEKLQIQLARMTDEECGAKVKTGLSTDFKLRGQEEEMFFTKVPEIEPKLGGKRKTRRRLKKRHTRKIKRKH